MMVIGIKSVTTTLGISGEVRSVLKINLVGFIDQESHLGLWA